MGKRRNWDELREVVEKINGLGVSLKDGAKEYGIKVGDVYEYNRRINKKKRREAQRRRKAQEDIQAQGVLNAEESLDARGSDKDQGSKEKEEISGSNKRISLPEDIQKIIVDYKKEHPDHGFKRIEDHLKSRHLVVVTRKKIREVLKEHGLLELGDSSFDRNKEPDKGSRRFEARYPHELYQMDVTYVYITGIPVLYLIDILDDYSRFCVAAELCRDQRADTLLEVFHNACQRYGTPEKLLTDQGSGFYSWSLERTRFQDYLDEMGIEHIVADAHSPQTLGKVEKFHQSIKNELIRKVRFSSFEEASRQISKYIMTYNYERPHQGIGGARPADRFHGVIGETQRLEAQLSGREIDLSRGYLVLNVQGHTVSVASSSGGLQVFLDGNLLS